MYVIVVRNGPVWNLDGLAALAETLAESYAGEIWTFADSAEERSVGSFRVRRDRLPQHARSVAKLLHAVRLVCRGLRLRWVDGRRLVVITYDPFVSGLVGAVLKRLAGARFVCEVNGVYGDPDNLIDMKDQVAASQKRRRMLSFGSRVLALADHIKLLFPEQLEGFREIPASIPRSVFLDFVDARHFPPAESDAEQLLLFVGHPLMRKGVDVLLRAFSQVRADYPDWRLVLIGFRIEEQAIARELPIQSVDFLGPQPQAVIGQWLERCQALVLPSRSEAMGRVLIEAAFKGRARLGSRVGGIPYYISHDVDGLLFQPDDVDDLAATLRRFMGDRTAPKRLGDAARARAERYFTPERYLRSYGAVLGDL